MNKKKILIVVSILAVAGFWVLKKNLEKKNNIKKTSILKMEGNTYWTCPMHPQIHLDHEGECPICHMKLVKVTQVISDSIRQLKQEDKRSSVQVSEKQLELIGIQKTSVERMSLMARIPISGRVISSTSVAFQVYEKDLSYVRLGLAFKGNSTAVSTDEGISGNITSIDSMVDPSSRTIRVIGLIKKGPKKLLPETSFSGEIEIELKDRLAIPESSVVHTGTRDLVYLFKEENRLTPKAVKLGIKTEGFYEVLSDLSAGDVISSGPNFLIDSEAKIRGAND